MSYDHHYNEQKIKIIKHTAEYMSGLRGQGRLGGGAIHQEKSFTLLGITKAKNDICHEVSD